MNMKLDKINDNTFVFRNIDIMCVKHRELVTQFVEWLESNNITYNSFFEHSSIYFDIELESNDQMLLFKLMFL